MIRGALLPLAILAALAGCGRVGPPRVPGPADQVVYPRAYPRYEPLPQPPPAPPPGSATPAR